MIEEAVLPSAGRRRCGGPRGVRASHAQDAGTVGAGIAHGEDSRLPACKVRTSKTLVVIIISGIYRLYNICNFSGCA